MNAVEESGEREKVGQPFLIVLLDPAPGASGGDVQDAPLGPAAHRPGDVGPGGARMAVGEDKPLERGQAPFHPLHGPFQTGDPAPVDVRQQSRCPTARHRPQAGPRLEEVRLDCGELRPEVAFSTGRSVPGFRF